MFVAANVGDIENIQNVAEAVSVLGKYIKK